MLEDKTNHGLLRSHYAGQSSDNLTSRILDALRGAGRDIDHLRPGDLAPIDEFHTLGRVATLDLAQMADIGNSATVLDVGCGIGGPARTLAAQFGCSVTGVDLFGEYCATAMMLTGLVGLSGRVSFCQADALALPFCDDSFDVLWSQHLAMNIRDKAGLYREMQRVLKPGGTLAIFDVLVNRDGPAGPIHLPVPWAREAPMNCLVSEGELVEDLRRAGFTPAHRKDATADALRAFVKLEGRVREDGLPHLGTHILLGPDFETMISNQLRNFQERRVSVIQIIAKGR